LKPKVVRPSEKPAFIGIVPYSPGLKKGGRDEYKPAFIGIDPYGLGGRYGFTIRKSSMIYFQSSWLFSCSHHRKE